MNIRLQELNDKLDDIISAMGSLSTENISNVPTETMKTIITRDYQNCETFYCGAKAIRPYLFSNMQEIKHFVSDGLVEIKEGAFSNSEINTINAPNLKIIGDLAFYRCFYFNFSTINFNNITNLGFYSLRKYKCPSYIELPSIEMIAPFPIEETPIIDDNYNSPYGDDTNLILSNPDKVATLIKSDKFNVRDYNGTSWCLAAQFYVPDNLYYQYRNKWSQTIREGYYSNRILQNLKRISELPPEHQPKNLI